MDSLEISPEAAGPSHPALSGCWPRNGVWRTVEEGECFGDASDDYEEQEDGSYVLPQLTPRGSPPSSPPPLLTTSAGRRVGPRRRSPSSSETPATATTMGARGSAWSPSRRPDSTRGKEPMTQLATKLSAGPRVSVQCLKSAEASEQSIRYGQDQIQNRIFSTSLDYLLTSMVR